jgi:hypothetical protein
MPTRLNNCIGEKEKHSSLGLSEKSHKVSTPPSAGHAVEKKFKRRRLIVVKRPPEKSSPEKGGREVAH